MKAILFTHSNIFDNTKTNTNNPNNGNVTDVANGLLNNNSTMRNKIKNQDQLRKQIQGLIAKKLIESKEPLFDERYQISKSILRSFVYSNRQQTCAQCAKDPNAHPCPTLNDILQIAYPSNRTAAKLVYTLNPAPIKLHSGCCACCDKTSIVDVTDNDDEIKEETQLNKRQKT